MDAYRMSRSSVQHELGCIINCFKNFKRRSVHLLTDRWVINCAGNENQEAKFYNVFYRIILRFCNT